MKNENPPVEAITLDELTAALTAETPSACAPGEHPILAGRVFDHVRDALRPAARAKAQAVAQKLREAQPSQTQGEDFRAKIIARDQFLALGMHESAVTALFTKADPAKATDGGIYWDELVCLDGMLALAVLPTDDLHGIAEELRGSGAPVMAGDPRQIAHVLYAGASMYVPEGAWSRPSLQSAVAASLLLKLAEQAWGKKRIILATGH